MLKIMAVSQNFGDLMRLGTMVVSITAWKSLALGGDR